MIEIIDWDHELANIGVNYDNTSWLNIPAPRLNGQWVTGSDLDRYCAALHPAQPQSEDFAWAMSLMGQPIPEGESPEVVNRVIAYRQAVFRSQLVNGKLGDSARIIEGNGSHEFVVPSTCNYIQLVVWSSGGETWSEGPGLYYTSGCQVKPDDTIYITIGTTTTLTSTMGSIELFSGWSAPGQVPQHVYRTMPWGHVGRAGAVMIY